MTDQHSVSWKRSLKPYIFITVAGLLAFAPVGFMLRALKNDIIALEYPINYFISQCIHNGEAPVWFNTWGMGFPLQSNLTWGPFSTPQVLFSSLFNYNIYVLHIEFMFFVLLSGWSMFHLLRHHFLKDERLAQLLATCYMLSGFMVGSSQWLLYITAAAFVPIVLGSLLQLLKKPSAWHAIQFAVMYTLMFTSVYAAFNIITTYSLLLFVPVYLIGKKHNGKELKKTLLLLGISVAFIAILCLPCLYYTMELLQYIGRGNAIETSTVFFNSNYLHPVALSNMLLPFSSVKMGYANTEGTMLNSYAGLLVLLLLPAAIIKTIRKKNRVALLLLLTTLFFLFTSFGKITFLRDALNVLPGFSYFRNPAIFRFYFLIALLLFFAALFRNTTIEELSSQSTGKWIGYTACSLGIICIVVLLMNLGNAGSIPLSITELVRNITLSQTLFISAAIQLCVLLLLLILLKKRKWSMVMLVLTAELIINTLVCTPFFTVSSYSPAEASRNFHSEKGFPVQTTRISETTATPQDEKGNLWYNVNVYSKQVSSQPTYRGPLTLKVFSQQVKDSSNKNYFDQLIVFADSVSPAGKWKVLAQRPTHIRVETDLVSSTTITALQNYYPGWKAYYNDQPVAFVNLDKPGLSVQVPAGKGMIDFRYEKKQVWRAAMLLHILVIIFFIAKMVRSVRKGAHASTPLST